MISVQIINKTSVLKISSPAVFLLPALILFLIFPAFSQVESPEEGFVSMKPVVPIVRSETGESFYELPDSIIPINSISGDRSSSIYSFYKNLEEAANKTFLTKKLHNLVMQRRVLFSEDLSDQPREAAFEPFSGKTIKSITIQKLDVFGTNIDVEEDYVESPFLERIGNRLHFKTNTKIIESNLLFTEGEEIDPETLADNERLLRSLLQIEDARIYVYEDIFQPGMVDLVVMTRDYWSKGFNLEMQEVDEGIMEFYDRNIFGLGREAQFNLHFNNSESPSFGYEGVFRAVNLYGTFIDGRIHAYSIFNDKLFQISFSRSFYTPNIRYAGGASFSAISRIDNFRYPDTIYYNSPLRYNSHDYWIGRSFPIKKKKGDYMRSGVGISARLLSNTFYERPPVTGNLFYPFHNKNLWLFGIAYTRQNFYRSRYVYGLGQNEDIPTGSIAEFIAGFDDNQFFRRYYAGSRFATGFMIKKSAFFFSDISLGSFFNDGNYEQAVFSIQNKFFSPLMRTGKYSRRHFVEMRYSIGGNRFEEEYLSLSERYGIRGLRSPEMIGLQKLVFNLESVFFSPANILGFRFAYFGFADLGWIGSEKTSLFKTGFYGGFGAGLKVRSELMVFPAVVIRLAFYPVIPIDARFEYIYLGTEKARQPDVFRLQKPDLFRFR
jgi:hypothetical protein